MVNTHNSKPAINFNFIYETKTTHSKEMHSTWFGDDVIRFAPAAGRGAGGGGGGGAKSIVTCEMGKYQPRSQDLFPFP